MEDNEAQRKMEKDHEENEEAYKAMGGVNWEAQEDMDRDVRENRELYEALADKPDDE